MLLRIIGLTTGIIAGICIVLGIVLGIAGLIDTPDMDTGAIVLAVGVIAFYIAQIWLLRYSYRRKYAPGYWIAFVGTILPVIGVSLFFWIYA